MCVCVCVCVCACVCIYVCACCECVGVDMTKSGQSKINKFFLFNEKSEPLAQNYTQSYDYLNFRYRQNFKTY